MKIRKYNLLWLTFTLSAIFISCKKTDTTVGKSLQEKDGVFSHYLLEDFKISTGTIIKNDSLYGTSSNDFVYVGQYSDNEVGSVKAEAYLQLALGGDSPDFGTNPTCDSVMLQISFTSETAEDRIIQGNGSTQNSLIVRELATQVQTSTLNSIGLDYGVALDTIFYTAANHSSQTVTTKFPTSFGNTLLSKGNGNTNDEFKILFNGIALTTLESEESIVGYDINNDETWVRIFYHNEATGDTDNSLEYNFDLSTLTLDHHTHLESDKSSSVNFSNISETLTDNSNTNNELLLQNGIGASVLFTIEDLLDKIDTSKKILVNKAIIRLPIDANSYEDQFNEAVPFVRIFETNELGENIGDTTSSLLTDASFVTGGTNTAHAFDEDESYYEIDLTYYFQEILIGERSLNSLLITPNLSNTTLGVERSVIKSEDIVFKLFYSEI